MKLFHRQFPKSSNSSTKLSHSLALSKPVNSRSHIRRKSVSCCMLVLDESASTGKSFRMAGGQTITRIDGIRLAAIRYLEQLKNSYCNCKVGIVGFSQTARRYSLPSPVGKRFRHLVQALSHLRPRGATNLSIALTTALDEFDHSNALHGSIVIITDGAVNRNTHNLPQLIARAASMRMRIYTIGVGNNGDSEYDRDLLIQIAQSTGGRFFSAHSFETLCNALRRLS
jgi:Ca-activated chloride channel family protein